MPLCSPVIMLCALLHALPRHTGQSPFDGNEYMLASICVCTYYIALPLPGQQLVCPATSGGRKCCHVLGIYNASPQKSLARIGTPLCCWCRMALWMTAFCALSASLTLSAKRTGMRRFWFLRLCLSGRHASLWHPHQC